MAQIAKHQRFLLVDYLDDLGEKHMVVFQPVAGKRNMTHAQAERLAAALTAPGRSFGSRRCGTPRCSEGLSGVSHCP